MKVLLPKERYFDEDAAEIIFNIIPDGLKWTVTKTILCQIFLVYWVEPLLRITQKLTLEVKWKFWRKMNQ